MRARARELAFQLIFERLFVKEPSTPNEEFFASLKKEEDKEFAKNILKAFEDNRDKLSDIVSSHLKGYEIDRVFKVDLALIYEALTEIFYLETPCPIAINEVVELSKIYSTTKSKSFINGVLSAIIKDEKN